MVSCAAHHGQISARAGTARGPALFQASRPGLYRIWCRAVARQGSMRGGRARGAVGETRGNCDTHSSDRSCRKSSRRGRRQQGALTFRGSARTWGAGRGCR